MSILNRVAPLPKGTILTESPGLTTVELVKESARGGVGTVDEFLGHGAGGARVTTPAIMVSGGGANPNDLTAFRSAHSYP